MTLNRQLLTVDQLNERFLLLLQKFELVYEVPRQIPKGKVISYGAIAACLGTKLSARMVGWAMNGEMIK